MYASRVLFSSNEREWIVFIHGFGGSARTWDSQVDLYAEKYNLLLLDLHKPENGKGKLDLMTVARRIALTMENHGIEKAHFLSASFGSLLAIAFVATHPEKVISMVMGGGIVCFNLRTSLLLAMARALKNILPYMWLYRFFAFIIMPRRNHRKSRGIFVREAKKLGHREFTRWVDLIPEAKKSKGFIQTVNRLANPPGILYIMGSQDHLFLREVEKRPLRSALVHVIPECGHVCFIEKAAEFSALACTFFSGCRVSFQPGNMV
ncbi:MAG: alpha/beta hydrolase [Clostridia bacterium]